MLNWSTRPGTTGHGHLFCLASEILEADKLHLFLLSDGTRIDNNKYLSSLENSTELIDEPSLCFEDQCEALQTSRKNCRLPGKP